MSLSLFSARPAPARLNPVRYAAIRRLAGWFLLSGWVVLLLLPAIGFGLSALVGLF